MGADQSTPRNGNSSAAPRKTCYYEVLGIERQATEDEIRKAYRKKALELHPDRNLDDTENATRKFAEVQTAYEILSDPQERAWYDSHRDNILNGSDAELDPDDGHPSSSSAAAGHTSAQAIFSLMGRFNSTVPMDDSSRGFFGILGAFFDQLATEEVAACEWQGIAPVAYPPFGRAEDDYATVARPFYSAWSSFSTRKSFAWMDRYRPGDAPDRRVRRLVEKENKKLREEAAREFNDAVLSLVAFVRKRDPRYVSNTQSEAERQKFLRDSAAAQAARARAANQEKLAAAASYVIAEWARSPAGGEHDAELGVEGDDDDGEEDEEEVEQIECIVCTKTFKSEKQFEAHERSKKHIKAVQQLQRQMKKENAALDLAGPKASATGRRKEGTKPGLAEEEDAGSKLKDGEGDDDGVDNDRSSSPATKAGHTDEQKQEEPVSVEPELREDTGGEDDGDDDYAPRAEVESRLISENTSGQNTTTGGGEKSSADTGVPDLDGLAIDDDRSGLKKVGKAKQKRDKRAARQAASAQAEEQYNCAVCKEAFPSRTKLFSHINDFGHAAPVQQKSNPGSRKQRR